MASLEDVFNGDFGKKDNKKPLLSKEPQIKVFHSPPAPIEEVISEPVTPYSATPVFGSTTPVVSEKYDYADLSKEELLIIIQADKFLKKKPAPKTIFHEHMRVQQSINEYTTEETPPVNVPKVKQKIKWREYGGWWLSIGLSTIVILLLITLLGR